MIKWIKYMTLALVSLLAFSCEDEDNDPTLNFIGDSLIARWDLAQSFPQWVVKNYGISGSGLWHIEDYAGRFSGQKVVVMIGTNDNNEFMAASREAYADKYMAAILALDASHVYLYSVLPRAFAPDRPDINDDIRAFDDIIKERVKAYPQITYMDVYNDFIYKGSINWDLYNDGLHMSVYGYEVLTRALVSALNK